jgi:hypothetical protein
LIEQLVARASSKLIAEADHSFHVPARSGRKDAQVIEELVSTLDGWIRSIIIP